MGARSQGQARTASDAWTQTLAALAGISPSEASAVNGHGHRDRAMATEFPRDMARRLVVRAKVQVLDRPSKNTAIISWIDPTACFYGHQTWRSSKSRQYGTCALSGCDIKAGDRVYRPRNARPCPLNANAMVLAAYLEDLYEYAELSSALNGQ